MHLFTTSLNKKLLYASRILDPQAWLVDFLNILWKKLVAYAFPPTTLLPKVAKNFDHKCANVQDNLDCPRLANETMVLGPSGDVTGRTKTSTNSNAPQTLPLPPSIPKPSCMVSRKNKTPTMTGSLQRWQKDLLLHRVF